MACAADLLVQETKVWPCYRRNENSGVGPAAVASICAHDDVFGNKRGVAAASEAPSDAENSDAGRVSVLN